MPPCENGEMETPRIKSSRPFSEDCPEAEGSEPTGNAWYRLARKRARRDGLQEVGSPNSTCEAGEPAPGDPVEGSG